MRGIWIANSGERIDKTEWHRVVTFQNGLIDMLDKNARKGRLVYVAGKMQTRRWKKDGEDSERFSTEILLVARFQDPVSGQGQRRCGRARGGAGERRAHAGGRQPGASSRRHGGGYTVLKACHRFLPPHLDRCFGAGLFFCRQFRVRPRPGLARALGPAGAVAATRRPWFRRLADTAAMAAVSGVRNSVADCCRLRRRQDPASRARKGE